MPRQDLKSRPWDDRCLAQLDDEKIWASLRRPAPDPLQPLPFAVVAMIFRFNLLIFGVILLGMAAGGALMLEYSLTDLLQPPALAGILGAVATGASLFSAVAAAMYRGSWNRRVVWRTLEDAP